MDKTEWERTIMEVTHMAHKHTCLDCGATIEEGTFDCEIDADHDFARCANCITPCSLACASQWEEED